MHKEIKNITQFIFNRLTFPDFCLILLHFTFLTQQLSCSCSIFIFYSCSLPIYFALHIFSLSSVYLSHSLQSSYLFYSTCMLSGSKSYFFCLICFWLYKSVASLFIIEKEKWTDIPFNSLLSCHSALLSHVPMSSPRDVPLMEFDLLSAAPSLISMTVRRCRFGSTLA